MVEVKERAGMLEAAGSSVYQQAGDQGNNPALVGAALSHLALESSSNANTGMFTIGRMDGKSSLAGAEAALRPSQQSLLARPGVYFDPSTRIFRLYSRETLYAFRIDDNRNLEHLYYGSWLQTDDNLTYLSLGNVPGPFDPHGIVPSAVEPNIMQTMGLDELQFSSEQELQQKWRLFTRAKNDSAVSGDFENTGRPRRLENASWRLWHMERMKGSAVDLDKDLSDDVLERALQRGGKSLSQSASEKVTETQPQAILPSGEAGGELVDASDRASSTAPGSLHRFASTPALDLSRSEHSLASVITSPRLDWNRGKRDSMGAPKEAPARMVSGSAAEGPQGPQSVQQSTAGGKQAPSLMQTASELDLDSGQKSTASVVNWGKLDQETISKNVKLLEISDSGTGDYRIPSIGVIYEDGSTLSPFTYRRHRIRRGKIPMPNYMPAVFTEDVHEATTLIVEMVDNVTGLVVELIYCVVHDYDVITRHCRIRNEGDANVIITRAMSATLDFETDDYYLTQLSGSWARERQQVIRHLRSGQTSFGSTRGGSSHQHNPFAIISAGEPNEDTGEAFAALLVYSGNFLVECEVSETGRTRLNIGIHPQGFYWNLEPDEEFITPEVILTYSAQGIGEMSRRYHRLIRDRLQPPQFRTYIPPVLLNTWEALYFQLSHESVLKIAEVAKRAGIEMIVIDDGWFGRRNDTSDGLGDWYPNPTKLPFGLHGLVRELTATGLKVGLWVEPEMVSVESDLFKAHPDWALHIPSRGKTMGRNQLVLDLTRSEVRDWLVDTMSTILSSCAISYIKWDNNRFLTEVYSAVHPPERQGEIAHRYILGLYEVLGRIQEQFPDVFFETCAGGGGRFDAGLLYYSSQIWTSDNTDASSRMRIQAGTSLWAPAKAIAAHVSTVPNHQTLRSAPMKTRSLVAMCGTFGYELDPRVLSEDELREIRHYIELYRQVAPVVLFGDMYRLWCPFRTQNCAWMYVSADRNRALVFAFNQIREVGRLEPRLRLRGLDAERVYEVEEWCPGVMQRNTLTGAIEAARSGVYQYAGNLLRMTGRTLMLAGLPIKFVFDADSVLLNIEAVDWKYSGAREAFRTIASPTGSTTPSLGRSSN
ncbi:alpha-galactosidase [Cyanidioschyzon merolae strain 10D]|jgi:alpha-galactosidase|uniref:alpha-galactosidase n=1 Tax=Cyanidioschyzon merolae (strain NIES-3377 / 10D) TaxID=280699 RepID=M1UQ07_CYAM1|nr:alpha-galactosidase [Cyanidioschyzon merolae strain 10D]BAM79576.1 alpha-galactosidase [Cyanidioschyzon merolae strain 10D]|eukprot:XP_005535862.1 alpha-galactosidase [Cyanidioschyzon merolae strain 10D]